MTDAVVVSTARTASGTAFGGSLAAAAAAAATTTTCAGEPAP